MPTVWLYRDSYARLMVYTAGPSAFLCCMPLSWWKCQMYIYMWAKCQKSEFFKDNCACSLSVCIRLLWCVSSTYLADREERCATGYLSIEMCKQHARGFSSWALYLGLKGQKRCKKLLHPRVLQQFSAVKHAKKFELNNTEKWNLSAKQMHSEVDIKVSYHAYNLH